VPKRTNRVPPWLRGLRQVKAELRGVRFPRTAEEGFRQGVVLSAASLRMLEEQEDGLRAEVIPTLEVDAPFDA